MRHNHTKSVVSVKKTRLTIFYHFDPGRPRSNLPMSTNFDPPTSQNGRQVQEDRIRQVGMLGAGIILWLMPLDPLLAASLPCAAFLLLPRHTKKLNWMGVVGVILLFSAFLLGAFRLIRVLLLARH